MEDTDSVERKRYNRRLLLIIGALFFLFISIQFDLISTDIMVLLTFVAFILLFLLHWQIRKQKVSSMIDIKTKRILFLILGFLIFVMGVGRIRNLEVLSWIMKLLPGNLDLISYIYKNFISGMLYILFGIFFMVVPWLTMWDSRKKVAAFMFSFLFFFFGVDYIFINWDSSMGMRNLVDSMSGLLYIFIGCIFAYIFMRNPKSIENLP